MIEKPQEYPADRIASLRARIAALEKCIEARDLLIDHLDEFAHAGGDAPLRDAIRRADEEAGRIKKERGDE